MGRPEVSGEISGSRAVRKGQEIHLMSSASAAGMSLAPRQDALLQAHRSPPPQNKTTDKGEVDRYTSVNKIYGTQMVCDARALAYRLVHRVTQKQPCRSRAENKRL